MATPAWWSKFTGWRSPAQPTSHLTGIPYDNQDESRSEERTATSMATAAQQTPSVTITDGYRVSGPFDELIGYEINSAIYHSAHAHLEKRRSGDKNYSKITILLADATARLPVDRDLVVFMYNPFGPQVMGRLVDRIKMSEHRTVIYYANPVHRETLETSLGLVGTSFSSFLEVRYLVFQGGRSQRA